MPGIHPDISRIFVSIWTWVHWIGPITVSTPLLSEEFMVRTEGWQGSRYFFIRNQREFRAPSRKWETAILGCARKFLSDSDRLKIGYHGYHCVISLTSKYVNIEVRWRCDPSSNVSYVLRPTLKLRQFLRDALPKIPFWDGGADWKIEKHHHHHGDFYVVIIFVAPLKGPPPSFPTGRYQLRVMRCPRCLQCLAWALFCHVTVAVQINEVQVPNDQQ